MTEQTEVGEATDVDGRAVLLAQSGTVRLGGLEVASIAGLSEWETTV